MITLDIHLPGSQTSQYTNYPFNSMCKIGDKYVGASSDGLFELLPAGGDDNGVPIDAFLELAMTDFGIEQFKRIRFLYVGFEADGDFYITLIPDEQGENRVDVEIKKPTGQQRSKFSFGRRRANRKGRYWTLRIGNVDGADFSLDSIRAKLIVLPSSNRGY
jgi:hypothetical protein